MLEKYIAALLVPYLSKYVENIDERQLSIDIWSGKATLHDLILKKDVLNTILDSEPGADTDASSPSSSSATPGAGGSTRRNPLPLRVHRGICKSVTLDIPIKNLRSSPVVLNIGEILITLVAPEVEGEPATNGEEEEITRHDVTVKLNHKSLRWDRIATQKEKALDAFEDERRKQREAAAAAAAAVAATTTTTAAAPEDPNGATKKGGFFSKLAELVINNIIVKAKTVHIRYEDPIHRVVLGAVLGGVQLLTIDDATGEATFVDPSGLRRIGKRLELDGLQVYCDDPRHMTANELVGRCWVSQIADWQAWYHAMRQRSRDGSVALSTVLGPVTCSVDARIVFKQFVQQMLETPYMTVTAHLQHIIAHLTRAQYTTIVKSIARFTNWSEVAEVAARRPRVPVKGHAKVWWRFAIGTVMEVLREPREAHVLQRISEICQIDYQVLYRDVVRKVEMSSEKKRSYRFITRFMTVEDMIAGRKHVYAQLANEIQLKRKDNEARRAEALGQQQLLQQQPGPPTVTLTPTAPPQKQKQGWLQWVRGAPATTPALSTAATDSMAGLSKEEAEEEFFFRNLEKDYGITTSDGTGGDGDDDEQSGPLTSSLQLPASYTWLFLSLSLPLASFQIDMEDGESGCLSFFQLRAQVSSFNKSNSAQFHFSAQNLTLSNPATGHEGGELIGNLVEGVSLTRGPSRRASSTPSSARSRPTVVRSITDLDNGKLRAECPPTLREMLGLTSPLTHRSHEHAQDGGGAATPRATSHALCSSTPSPPPAAAYATPLLSFSGALHPVEQPFADTKLDLAIVVRLLPLRVVADPGTIRRIVHFFRVPRGVDLAHFADSTRHAASAVGTAASQELRAAMASAKGLYVSMDASAPIILLPKTLRATRQETTLAVSLGRIRFETQPLSDTEKQLRLQSTTETEEMLYYSNRASFSKFFVELTTLEKAVDNLETGMMLVPNLAIAADVLQRIDDRSDSREAVILRLKVPELRVALSVHQVYLLTNMIDAWGRNWATGAASAAVAQSRQREVGAGGTGGREEDGLDRSYSPSLQASAHSRNTAASNANVSAAGGGNAQLQGRRPGTSGGMVSDVSSSVSVSSSPTVPPTLLVRSEDLPLFRLELLVQSLGLDVHEDDPDTLVPILPPRFSLAFDSVEFILAVRTLQKKILLYFKEPCVVDLKAPEFHILSGSMAVRVDVGFSPDLPTAVGVVVEPSVKARVGTPLVELLENIMDVVNLILSCIDAAEEQVGEENLGSNDSSHHHHHHQHNRTASSLVGVDDLQDEDDDDDLEAIRHIGVGYPGAPLLPLEEVNRQMEYLQSRKGVLSDLAYQLGLVRLQNATPDARVVNISIHIDGTTTVELFNRAAGEQEDQLFLSASVTDVNLFLKRNRVTMEMTGRVGEAAVRLAESHGLLKENSAILLHSPPTPTHHHSSRSSAYDGTKDPNAGENTAMNREQQSTVRTTPPPAPLQPQVSFTYRKSRPVMPIFANRSDGKRVLANASELRFSNAVELELGGSTVNLDVHSVMLLKLYFTTGFFSRLSLLADRPVYNGRTLPPTREGPRLLMSVRVVARDITLTLPLDARRTTECFSATLGNLVVQSSLHAAEARQTTSVSLREVALWRDTTKGPAHSLLPSQAYIEVAMRSPIDLKSEEDARLDVRSEDLTVDITSSDLLDLCRLVRQNASRATVSPNASVAVNPLPRILAGQKNGVATQRSEQQQQLPYTALHGGRVSGLSANFSSTSAHTNGGSGSGSGDIIIGLRFGRAALRFSTDAGDDDCNDGTGVGAASFELGVVGIALLMNYPSLAASLSWKSLELLDTRGGTASALIRCDAGEAHMADSLTTKSIVMSGFGVRPMTRTEDGLEDGSTIAGDDENTSTRTDKPGGVGTESLTSSDATASPTKHQHQHQHHQHRGASTVAGAARRSILTAAETGVGSSSNGALPATTGRSREFATGAFTRTKSGGGGGGGGGGEGGANAPTPPTKTTAAAGAAMTPNTNAAESGTGLLSMSVLSVAFTLRRCAVSDQWLSLYDYFCNEAVAAVWSAPLAGLSDDGDNTTDNINSTGATPGKNAPTPEPPAPAPSSSSAGGSRGFRCVVTTPSVAVPFLTADRQTLFEASISALLVDTVTLPGLGTQVAVKVRELEMIDCKSGERVVTRRRRFGVEGRSSARDDCYYSPDDEEEILSLLAGCAGDTTFNASAQQPPCHQGSAGATAMSSNSNSHPHHSSGKEPEALSFLFRADPDTHKNRVLLSMGRLDVVCAMPMLHGMIDYFLSPTQPIARISALGVMREQRARVARAAQQMADANVMSIHVLWHQPRIVLVGDGTDLTNHTRRLEARLGRMRANIRLDKPNSSLTTSVKIRDFSIPELLERSALQVSYSSVKGEEEISITLERMVGLFFPTDIDRVVYVLYGNLLLPKEVQYYGKLDSVAATPTSPDAAATSGAGPVSPQASPTAESSNHDDDNGQNILSTTTTATRPTAVSELKRTIMVQVNGLVLEVHDFAGINTHTFTLSSLALVLAPSGDLSLAIPTISIIEHFTHCTILSSGCTDASGQPLTETPKAAAARATSAATSDSTSDSTHRRKPSQAATPAVTMVISKADNTTVLTVTDVVFALVPRGTGALANTLLSLQIPQVSIARDALAKAEAERLRVLAQQDGSHIVGGENNDDDDALSTSLSLTLSRKIEAPIPTSQYNAEGSLSSPPPVEMRPKPAQSFKASLAGCGLRFMHSEMTVAFAKFSTINVVKEDYKDGSGLLKAVVDDFTLEDAYSLNPTHKQIITRYVDDETDLDAASVRADARARKLLEFTLWTAPTDDKVSRTLSISQRSRGSNMYAKRVYCEVANLSFAVVPDVAKALAGTVSEVLQHVSEANRGKAYEYVSDTATAAAHAVVSETALDLTELEVVIHRPRFIILNTADAQRGVELFPGRLLVRSELGLPEASAAEEDGKGSTTGSTASGATHLSKAPPSPMNDLYREVFHMRVERMGVKLLGEDAFKKSCHVNVLYQTALPAPPSMEQLMADIRAELVRDGLALPQFESPGSTASRGSRGGSEVAGNVVELRNLTAAASYREESELRVTVPSIAMNLSEEQTRFCIDVIGAFVSSEVVKRPQLYHESQQPQQQQASSLSGPASVMSGGASSMPSVMPLAGPGTTTTSAFDTTSHHQQQQRRKRTADSGSPLATGSDGVPSPTASSAHRAQQQRAAAALPRKPPGNPNAVFRTDFYIGLLEADLAELFRLRVTAAHARSQSSPAAGSRSSIKVKSLLLQHVGAEVEVADASTGERHSTRTDDLVDLLMIRRAVMDTNSPPVSIDAASMTSFEEKAVDIAFQTVRVAVSPTILFDTREMLYLPFCDKVLRQPIEPVPVLKLEEELTVLTQDLRLDNMHVLLTCNRKRCCYHLNLGKHTLRLTGQPTGQIVLNEGCQLTISNGTVVIPGLYAIGSYVSFAASTALFTTDTCTIEKRYQNIPNAAFVVHSGDSMRAAAAAVLAAHGDGIVRGSGGGGGGERRAAEADELPTPSSHRIGGPGEAARKGNDGGSPLIQQRNTRVVGSFTCGEVVFQVLSEETTELSSSLSMEANMSFMQDTENDAPVRRNVSLQLLQLQSGVSEQHTLLPTSVSANFSGVENVSIAVVFGPLELCSRAVLLRSLVEVAKDFGAAFIEETTVKRLKPTIQLETPQFVPLLSVMTAGDCQHCGQHVAYFSENANTAGTLCYKCCTGRESMPATDVRVEIPLLDVILLAASGDIAHAYVRNVLFSVDANMDAQVSLRGAIHNFSNAAAVWEPCVEQFSCNASGSVSSHDYSVRVDRLDYVVSPHNVRVFSTLMADYASSTTLQKRMRKKFRRQTQQRADTGYNTAPMYVEEVAGSEEARAAGRVMEATDELTFGSTLRGGFSSSAAAAMSNMSIFDYLASTQRRSINADLLASPLTSAPGLEEGSAASAGPQPSFSSSSPVAARTYAFVRVENCCNATLLVGKKPVPPRGGTLELRAITRDILVEREQPNNPTDTGYLLSLTNPALYVQANDLMIETKVDLSRDEASRLLRRVVDIRVLPLHVSKTLICCENKLSCWLSPGNNVQDLAPGDRYYVRASTNLNAPLVVRPTRIDSGVLYAPGVTEDEGRPVTLQEVLTGMPVTLVCRPVKGSGGAPSSEAAATIFARVVVRQEAIRGGVPTFIISVEPRYKLSNKLPYTVLIGMAEDRSGDVAKGRTRAKIQQTIAVEAMQKLEVGTKMRTMEEVALTLEVHQASMAASPSSSAPSTAAGAKMTSAAAAASSSLSPAAGSVEVFSSMPIAVKSGFVKLTSPSGRELVVRVIVSGGNVLLTTPFTLLNHTDYPLQLRECNAKGEIRRVNAERSYSALAPRMNNCIAASPIDVSKEEFFVNVYSGAFSAKAIPFHVHQRGLILMEELVPANAQGGGGGGKSSSSSSSSKKRNPRNNLGIDVPDRGVLHLAYLAKIDASGAVLVTITPRWVVVNRSPSLPLYVVPTAQAGLSVTEAQAGATAELAAERADKSSPAGTPTTQQKEIDAFKSALLELAAATDTRLTDMTYVVAVGPKTAKPVYLTPYCIPELGYHAHVLQSPESPLYGIPVQLETIHSETIVSYHPRDDVNEDVEGSSKNAGSPSRPRRAKVIQHDRFFEVSLVAQNSYTFITIEEPETVPYLFLNRTRYELELRDTAKKSAGRLMARAASGCGTELILDSTVSTVVRVVPSNRERPLPGGVSEVRFDVSRPMTSAERAAPPGGLIYQVGYGELGQTVLEVLEAIPQQQRTLSARACPLTPINVLLNMAVFTVAVVIPNRDVLFAAVTDTRISWDRAEHKEEFQFSVKNFQVDNQTEISPRYDSCVLALRKSEEGTALSGNFKRTIVAAKALLWLDEIRLDVAPVALRVSDTLLVTLAHFARTLSEETAAAARSSTDSSIAAAAGVGKSTTGAGAAAAGSADVKSGGTGKAGGSLEASISLSATGRKRLTELNKCPSQQRLYGEAPRQMDFMATRIILDKLIVNPLLIRLWLTRDKDESDFFRDGLHAKEAALLSMMIPSCEDVNISAPGLVALKRSSRLGVLLQWIIKSYTDGLLAQLQGVLLQYASSLPLIGAPLKLFSGIGSGAVRLFKEPVEGLATSPKAFAQGLARGSGGFAAGFAGGSLGAFANLTNAGSRLLSMGGGVSEKERRKQNTWTGITSGITGIVQRPLEGAAESGVSGFAKGAAQGLVGVLANPFSGLLSDMSRATGTVAKLVTDTYIPQTRRLRPLRGFHANGGVAQWRSVITVYQYERRARCASNWSSDALLLSVDGPEWYPCRREAATYGKEKQPVPPDVWALDRHGTSFDGWTFSTKYYGYYSGVAAPEVRVRRKRWTALVRPLSYSPMAFYLGISPGMARLARPPASVTDLTGVSRTSSLEAGSGTDGDILGHHTTSATLDYVQPGVLTATTLQEATKRRSRLLGLHHRRSRSKERRSSGDGTPSSDSEGGGGGIGFDFSRHSRKTSDFLVSDEFADEPKSLHQRMRSWTAMGRNVGVKGTALRTASMDLDEELPVPRTSTAVMGEDGVALQRPSLPRSGAVREDREPKNKRSSSAGDGGGGSDARGWKEKEKVKGGSRQHSRSPSHTGMWGDEEVLPLPPKADTPPAAAPRLTAEEGVVATPTSQVELYEYEKVTLFGWGRRCLPSHCPPWQDAHGRAVQSKSSMTPPPGWVWADEWHTIGGDKDGGWTVMTEESGSLRRRLWRRTMAKQQPGGGTSVQQRK